MPFGSEHSRILLEAKLLRDVSVPHEIDAAHMGISNSVLNIHA